MSFDYIKSYIFFNVLNNLNKQNIYSIQTKCKLRQYFALKSDCVIIDLNK